MVNDPKHLKEGINWLVVLEYFHRGPQFRFSKYKSPMKIIRAMLRLPGVDFHNFVNVGERCHQFLFLVYSEISDDDPNMPRVEEFSFEKKAVDNTCGPN